MRVILSSNISHYRHAASALASSQRLGRYITGLAPIGKWRHLGRVLPAYWREKYAGRGSLIDPGLVSVLMSPDLVQKALYYSKLASFTRAEWASAKLFDLRAVRKVDRCDIFHFSSSVGGRSALRAKKLGAIVVCDERRVHPDVQLEIIQREHTSLGLPWKDKSLLNERVKKEYQLADFIIVPSSYAKASFVSQGFDPSRVLVVGYGVDDPIGRRPQRRQPEEFTILYAGRGEPLKGLHYLMDAYSALSFPRVKLVIVGDIDPGYGRYLRQLVPTDRSVKFVPHVPKARLLDHFLNASVLVQPSLSDSFSLVLLEAMSYGLPVISTNSVGASDVIRDGVDGYVVPPADPVKLREKLETLASNPQLRGEMGQRARDSSRGFGWENYQQALLAAYDQMMNAYVGAS